MSIIRKLSFAFFALIALALSAPADDSAQGLLAQGRVDEAITFLQGAISSSPDNAESYNLLCRSHFALADWDRAISACQKAVHLAPDNSGYHLWLGRAYGEKADRANFMLAASLAGKVRGEFERAVELDPGNIDARTDLAEFYLEAPSIVGGGHDKALAQADVLHKLDPAKAHWVYGRIAEKRKDRAGAEREYLAELEVSHHSGDGWLDLAIFYRREGQFDDMEHALKELSTAELHRRDALVDGAETLIRTDRNLPLATQLLRRYLSSGTVEEAPAFKAHYLLGTLLEKQGDKTAAAREYRTSLTLARNFGSAQEALNRLGQ